MSGVQRLVAAIGLVVSSKAVGLCVLCAVSLYPSFMTAQAEWKGVAMFGADFLNDSAGRGPALVTEIGVRRQFAGSGLMLQASISASQRRGRAELGVTKVRLAGLWATIGYRAVHGEWSPYLAYELGGQRVSGRLVPEGGPNRVSTVIATGVTGGVTRRFGTREVGMVIRHFRLAGPNTTRDQGLAIGVMFVF